MDFKWLILISLAVGCFDLCLSLDDDKGFKVPLEMRQKNRPTRLVDSTSDPGLGELKVLQDIFFETIQNSSLGNNYKSFDQVFSFLLSKDGSKIGMLLWEGIKIGFWRQDVSLIFEEFIDDFKYRLHPSFADAFINYVAFIKTIDIASLPLALESLFRKDQLGNSLAQLPMGQLVDIVQDEASKYGIDVREVINGILGKDSSSFPEFMDKIVNQASEYFSLTGSDSGNDQKDLTKGLLQLFKPGLGHMLKENGVDLDPDAVIHMASHFLKQGLQSSGGDKKKTGDKFGFEQLLPLMPLMSQFLSSGNKQQSQNSKTKGNSMVETAMNLIQGMTNGNGNMNGDLLKAAMGLMSQLGGKKSSKDRKSKSSPDAMGQIMDLWNEFNDKKGGNKQSDLIVNLLSNFVDGDFSKGLDNNMYAEALQGVVKNFLGDKSQSEDEDIEDTDEIQAAAEVLQSEFEKLKPEFEGAAYDDLVDVVSDILNPDLTLDRYPKDGDKSAKEKVNQNIDDKIKKAEEKEKKIPSASDVPKPKKSSDKTKDKILQSNIITKELAKELNKLLKLAEGKKYSPLIKKLILDFKKKIPDNLFILKDSLKSALKSLNMPTEDTLKTFEYAIEYWPYVVQAMKDEATREMMLIKGLDEITEIISLTISSQKIDTYLNMGYAQINSMFSNYGLRNVKLENFPQLLSPLLNFVPSVKESKIDATSFLKQIQKLLMKLKKSFYQNLKTYKSFSKTELRQSVRDSLVNDVSKPLGEVIGLEEAAREGCLVRAVCDAVNADPQPSNLKSAVLKIGSLFYGATLLEESSMELKSFLDVVRASLLPMDCQVDFPKKCSKRDASSKSEEKSKHTEL